MRASTLSEGPQWAAGCKDGDVSDGDGGQGSVRQQPGWLRHTWAVSGPGCAGLRRGPQQ